MTKKRKVKIVYRYRTRRVRRRVYRPGLGFIYDYILIRALIGR